MKDRDIFTTEAEDDEWTEFADLLVGDKEEENKDERWDVWAELLGEEDWL